MEAVTLRCQAILFDVDGVLVDSRAVVERTWARWAARHGLHRTDIAQTAHGRRTVETVREFAPQLDPDPEVAWIESDELNDTEGLTALPGSAAALHAVPEARRALVTSGGRAFAVRRMRAAGLPIPAIIVAAEDVAQGKPAPDAYLLAAARLAVDPRECVVIEDAPPGIAAGRAAGATVIALTTTFAAPHLTDAHVTVPSLAALRISLDATCLRIEVVSELPLLPRPMETR